MPLKPTKADVHMKNKSENLRDAFKQPDALVGQLYLVLRECLPQARFQTWRRSASNHLLHTAHKRKSVRANMNRQKSKYA